MLYIYLPGYSSRNSVEAGHVTDKLKQNGLQVYYHQWPHWRNPEIVSTDSIIPDDVIAEVEKVGDKDVVIIAKSIGTYVTMQVVNYLLAHNYQVKQLILMGIPINDLSKSDRTTYLQTFPTITAPMIVIQNELDAHGNITQVRELLQGVKYQEILKSGVDNHVYDYADEIYNLVVK